MSRGQAAEPAAGALRKPRAKKGDACGTLTVSATHKRRKGRSLAGVNEFSATDEWKRK